MARGVCLAEGMVARVLAQLVHEGAVLLLLLERENWTSIITGEKSVLAMKEKQKNGAYLLAILALLGQSELRLLRHWPLLVLLAFVRRRRTITA